MQYTARETAYLQRISERISELRNCLSGISEKEISSAQDWFLLLTKIKTIQGNIHNDLSFIGCLLAKQYLRAKFGIADFDAGAKAQGASGLDIDVTTPENERLIAEIKMTIPYSGVKGDLGSKQREAFRNDFAKLKRTQAKHKLLFVTDQSTFDILRNRYADETQGVQIVLLELDAVDLATKGNLCPATSMLLSQPTHSKFLSKVFT